jgi:hypothetical protein
MVVSFIGGGNRSTQRKPPTCRKSDKLYQIMLYRVHLAIKWGRLYSLSLFTVYMRFLHALLMSRSLGPKIIMIKEMVRVLQFCFSNGSCFDKTGFELTTLVVIGTDCTGSSKSDYYTIMTTTAPVKNIIEQENYPTLHLHIKDTHYIHSVMVHDFVSGRICCVN